MVSPPKHLSGARTRHILDTSIELIELIASQDVLNVRDVLAFSSTCTQIRQATRLLTAPPLYLEDPSGTDVLTSELSNGHLGLVRAAIVHVRFTIAESKSQSEQLRLVLSKMPNIKYLALRCCTDKVLNTSDPARDRPKVVAYPFPLRSTHFQRGYLSNLSRLELSSLSINVFVFAHMPRLTHLKLTLSSSYDGDGASEVHPLITAARDCRLLGFKISFKPLDDETSERLAVVKACSATWPCLQILNIISDCGFEHLSSDQNLSVTIRQTIKALELARGLQELSLSVVPFGKRRIPLFPKVIDKEYLPYLDVQSSLSALAGKFRGAFPDLKIFRCISHHRLQQPIYDANRFELQYYKVVRAHWIEGAGWQCTQEELGKNSPLVFGMV
ncbi:hypothetical protein RhiJN_06162 [Ceratobasidium sp. AG-Ba]|nr:hypothetical protein RhiJN_06162 [Ceratobasidium sp. AG-Ba]QRW07109.1 hypothetical protein RhiLY_06108 [Ceratobasidium sp. AG-Ba]